MTAEKLREAAQLMREEHGQPVDQQFRCACEDDGETFTDHWFDRSICPEPCGMMHDICCECGYPKGGCSVMADGRSKSRRLSDSWLAVADWLEDQATSAANLEQVLGASESQIANLLCDALAVARAYLNEATS